MTLVHQQACAATSELIDACLDNVPGVYQWRPELRRHDCVGPSALHLIPAKASALQAILETAWGLH